MSKSKDKNSEADPGKLAELRAQIARLKRWEESKEVYKEMLAAANERVMGK